MTDLIIRRGRMSDLKQNNQNDFITEKIKVKPVNKKKLIRRTIITISMAIIFGLVACVHFWFWSR